jgi:2-hydroxychromene-2-carboxylate isomerase
VVRTIVGEVGFDPEEFFDKIAEAPYKDRVRANTDECIRRGGFGSPTLFVGESMFFGNDRLVLIANELRTRDRGGR